MFIGQFTDELYKDTYLSPVIKFILKKKSIVGYKIPPHPPPLFCVPGLLCCHCFCALHIQFENSWNAMEKQKIIMPSESFLTELQLGVYYKGSGIPTASHCDPPLFSLQIATAIFAKQWIHFKHFYKLITKIKYFLRYVCIFSTN